MSEHPDALLARLDERTASTLREVLTLKTDFRAASERHERIVAEEAEARRNADGELLARVVGLEARPVARGFADQDTSPIVLREQAANDTRAAAVDESKARTRLLLALATLVGAATTALGAWAVSGMI